MNRRAVWTLATAGALLSAGLLVPGAAQAASGPGGLHLTPDHGSTHTAPFASYTSDNACPAANRSYGVALITATDGTVINIGDGFTPTDQPPSGAMTATTSLADTNLPTGDYEVDIMCYDDSFASIVSADSAVIHIDTTTGTWTVASDTTPPSGPVATTTTLTADPASAAAGADVKLTATVTGDGAAGSVEFDNGATKLGTADLADGKASTTVDDLPAGDDQITAKFTPTDDTAFAASTSDPVTVTITTGGGSTNPTGQESINVTVPSSTTDGDFTLTVDPTAVKLAVADSSATGSLSPITVDDERAISKPGWTVNGQVGDFTGTAGSITADNLGWTPAITGTDHGAVAGAAVEPGTTGLSVPAPLATAAAGQGIGSTQLGAGLNLSIPAGTPAGDYGATLTLTTLTSAAT